MTTIDKGLPLTPAHGGIRSMLPPETRELMNEDPVTRILKWLLLATAVACFAAIAWATGRTYQGAPPVPDRIVAQDGTTLIAGADIIAGKGGFQKADLMDYGSLYGMGSYFGPDYTAQNSSTLRAPRSGTSPRRAAGTISALFRPRSRPRSALGCRPSYAKST